jgi:hypothetical protein
VIACQKNYSLVVAPSGPHGPPNGPLQLDGATVALFNSFQKYLAYPCLGPPFTILPNFTGFMPYMGGSVWTETEYYSSIDPYTGNPVQAINSISVGGGGISIQFGGSASNSNANVFTVGGTLDAFPIGNITWNIGGLIQGEFCTPNDSSGNIGPFITLPGWPPVGGRVDWA